jgi:hypothetical protein
MNEHPAMSGIRSFEAPHKGLRHIISNFSYRLGFTDIRNLSELQKLKDLGHNMFILLKDHVHTENEVTLKELEAKVPGSSKHDMLDHERLEVIQQALESRLSSLTGNESGIEMQNLYLEFSRFHSLYLEHIYEEETVTEILLQNNFTDEELIQHRLQIMKRISPSTMLIWLKYIVPAQGIPESVGMLSGFRDNVPKEVFDAAMDNIRSEMDPDRFQLLMWKLKES